MLTIQNPCRAFRRTVLVAGLAAGLAGCTPRGPKALLEGERLLERGRPEEALRHLRMAVEFLPGNAQAWNHLGLAYHRAGRPGEAASAYLQASRLDPRLAVAPYNLGCLWLENGEPARAVDALRTHLTLQSRSLDGWRKLGQAQLRLGQWDLAEQSFVAALQLAPLDPIALNGLGIAHQQRRRPRDAWQCFTTATSRDPSFAPAWLNLGVASLHAGAPDHARAAFRRYVDLRPDAGRALGIVDQLARLEPPPPSPTPTPPGPGPDRNGPTNAVSAPRPESTRPTSVLVPAPAPALSAATTVTTGPPPEIVTRPAITSPPPALRDPVSAGPTPDRTPAPGTVATRPSVPEPARTPVVAVRTEPPVRPTHTPTPERAVASASPTVVVRSPSPASTATSSPPMVLAKATFPEPGASGAVASPPGVPGANLAEDRPGAAAPSGAPAVTAEPEPPPLVRPVGEQRASGSAPRRGFWERANPARWFGSESPEDTVAEDSNAREATPETAGNRWNWARPARWFRSDEEASDAASPASPTVGGEAPPAGAPASAPLLTEPTIRVVAAESRATAAPTPAEGPPRAVATATRPAVPSAPVAPRDWPRYDYRRPAVPPPGNRAAARPVLEQAMIEHRRGRWDTAVAQYVQALRIDPASVEAYQNLAAIRLQQGDLANALVLSEAALALQPESARTRLNFALALDRAGFPLDAVEQANRILERQPGDIAAHLLLGNLYAQKLDRPAPAREHYLKVIELDPQHPESIAVRRWLAGRP